MAIVEGLIQPMGDSVPVFERMRAIIVRQLGVNPDEVVPSARFVKDLRVD
jgi:acyl carrier protein